MCFKRRITSYSLTTHFPPPQKKSFLDTFSSGRGVSCTQVLATKPCGCQALQATRFSPWLEVKIPKADNTWDGHCPQKAHFCGNTIYLSALEGRLGHAYGATSRASIPSRLCPLCECGSSGTLIPWAHAYKAWGDASLSDVGLLHNKHAHTRQEDKAVRG